MGDSSFRAFLLTYIFLQILSNLSNDLRDTVNGADFTLISRGPIRAGSIRLDFTAWMKKAMYLFGALFAHIRVVTAFCCCAKHGTTLSNLSRFSLAAFLGCDSPTLPGSKPLRVRWFRWISVFHLFWHFWVVFGTTFFTVWTLNLSGIWIAMR